MGEVIRDRGKGGLAQHLPRTSTQATDARVFLRESDGVACLVPGIIP